MCLHQAMPLIALIAKVTVLPLADIDIYFFAVIYLLVVVIFPLQCQRNSKSGSLHSNLIMSTNLIVHIYQTTFCMNLNNFIYIHTNKILLKYI